MHVGQLRPHFPARDNFLELLSHSAGCVLGPEVTVSSRWRRWPTRNLGTPKDGSTDMATKKTATTTKTASAKKPAFKKQPATKRATSKTAPQKKTSQRPHPPVHHCREVREYLKWPREQSSPMATTTGRTRRSAPESLSTRCTGLAPNTVRAVSVTSISARERLRPNSGKAAETCCVATSSCAAIYCSDLLGLCHRRASATSPWGLSSTFRPRRAPTETRSRPSPQRLPAHLEQVPHRFLQLAPPRIRAYRRRPMFPA